MKLSPLLPTLLNNSSRLCLLGCLIFILLVAGKFNDFQVGAYQDDAHYVILSQALADERQFAYVNLPESAQRTPDYPIGFPLLLAPFQMLSPDRFWPLKLVGLFATIINGLLLYRWWPRWTQSTPIWGLVIALAYWFSPVVTEHARLVMSEAPFLTYYLLLLALLHRDKQREGRWWFLLIVPLLCGLLVLSRTIGVALIAGVGAYYLFSWRIRRLSSTIKISLLVAGSTILAVLLISGALVPQRYFSSKYLEYFISVASNFVSAETTSNPIDTTIFQQFAQNRWENIYEGLVKSTIPLLSSVAVKLDAISPLFIVQYAAGIGVMTLTMIGGVVWIRRVGWDAVWITGAAYIAILAVWHWNGTRLLYAIFPHLFFAFLLGCDALFFNRLSFIFVEKLRPLAVALFLGSLIVSSLIRNPSLGHVGDLRERTAWLNANVPTDAIVMSQYPETDYLYSPGYTLAWPSGKSAETISAYIDQHAVDYVLLAPAIEWDDAGYEPNWNWFIQSRHDAIIELAMSAKIEQVYRNEVKNIEVYKVNQTP